MQQSGPLTQRRGPGASARTAHNLKSRFFGDTNPHHAGACMIFLWASSRRTSRWNFVSDAIWRSTETGTRKTGTSTNGNTLMSSFGASSANNWNGEGQKSCPHRDNQIGDAKESGDQIGILVRVTGPAYGS
jgi:hypothetical protein